ncbi:MAG: histidine phosphatase family protein [Thermodesulfobacteriota bacterium]
MDREPVRSEKLIILARHGETVSNRDGLIMGQSDSQLTSRGLATVEALADKLTVHRPQVIYASSLGRAVSSAKIYSEKLGIPVVMRQSMVELSSGAWTDKTRDEVVGGRRHIRTSWTDRPPEGESYEDAESRVFTLVTEIEVDKSSEIVLVVGHASVNRVFLKLWLELEPDVALRVNVPHDSVYLLEPYGRVVMLDYTGTTKPGLTFVEG